MTLRRTVLPILLAASAWTAPQSFEVASVKLNTAGTRGYSMPPPKNGVLTFGNVTLKQLIAEALHVQDFQISGGPAWIGSDRYDIVAKAAGTPTANQMRPMILAMLADRFQLVFHREKKEMPIYTLILAKGGSKLRPAKDPDCSASPVSPLCGGFSIRKRSQIIGESVPLERLTDLLAALLDKPVVDQTGIEGVVDLHLEWAPDGVSNQGEEGHSRAPGEGASLFTALQEPLGLKLAPQKGMVDIIVVDRAGKASQN